MSDIFKSLEGKVLIASPHLQDTYFGRSLIYVCAHDITGAVGVIINNHIGTASIEEILKHANVTHSPKKRRDKLPIMFGGPVNSDKIVILSKEIVGNAAFINNHHIGIHTDIVGFLKDFSNGKNKGKFVIVKGVAAWESNQLESEIKDNSWFISDLSVDILFSKASVNKWETVIKKMGIQNVTNFVHYSGTA